MNELNKEQLKEMMESVAKRVVEAEPYLTKIDLKIGDGDHGTGMKRGFLAVERMLETFYPRSCEEVFQAVGTCLLDTMGGASGVLFGTVFISGIVKREERDTFSLKDFAEVFFTSLASLKKRGKAKVGDKTMVDALEPAVLALKEGSEEGLNLTEGLQKAAEAWNIPRLLRRVLEGQSILGKRQLACRMPVQLPCILSFRLWLIL